MQYGAFETGRLRPLAWSRPDPVLTCDLSKYGLIIKMMETWRSSGFDNGFSGVASQKPWLDNALTDSIEVIYQLCFWSGSLT